MFFRVFRKIIQRHLKYHLLIPLVVGLLIEYGAEKLTDHYHGDFWKVVGLLAPVLGILVTYLVVMYFVFKSETNIGIKRITSTKLEEALTNATGFLGLGAIELKEWFEPSPQVYLATIMKRKIEDPKFSYNRVLVFSKSAFKDLDSQYLNGHYAKALIDIHMAHGVGLGYLKPKEIDMIMKGFEVDEGKAIGYYPRWLPSWLLKMTPRSWRRIWIRKLALAVVQYKEENRYLPFSKHGVIVDVGEIDDVITEAARNSAYAKLTTKISEKVFKGAKIDGDHDFTKLF